MKAFFFFFFTLCASIGSAVADQNVTYNGTTYQVYCSDFSSNYEGSTCYNGKAFNGSQCNTCQTCVKQYINLANTWGGTTKLQSELYLRFYVPICCKKLCDGNPTLFTLKKPSWAPKSNKLIFLAPTVYELPDKATGCELATTGYKLSGLQLKKDKSKNLLYCTSVHHEGKKINDAYYHLSQDQSNLSEYKEGANPYKLGGAVFYPTLNLENINYRLPAGANGCHTTRTQNLIYCKSTSHHGGNAYFLANPDNKSLETYVKGNNPCKYGGNVFYASQQAATEHAHTCN